MPRSGSGGPLVESRSSDAPLEFFISYSPADERWATWIAWQLEASGHRTLIQAWDFVPGTNFIDFMDRGIRDAMVVVAVLSRNYLKSRYGGMEWQAALRSERDKLITVRVEDCPLEGLLATLTYLDLVGVTDPAVAQETLLVRLGAALAGRSHPTAPPPFPTVVAGDDPPVAADRGTRPPTPSVWTRRARRTPATQPGFPARRPPAANRDTVSILHVPGPRFGRGMVAAGDPIGARELQSRIWSNVTELTDSGARHPDLIVVSGDLMETGRPREMDEALDFVTGLRVLLGLEPDRVMIVPGARDISKAACLSYFAHCEAEDIEPQLPYFPKLDRYAQLFGELYQGLPGPLFDVAQPWTLFSVPELRVVVAGLNSTMALSHRPDDEYGWVGEAQTAWFAEQLRSFEESGWLRIGVVRHEPRPGSDAATLRDAGTLDRLLGRRLAFLVHGPGGDGDAMDILPSGLPVLPAVAPGREELIEVTADGLRRYSVAREPLRLERTWTGARGTFAAPEPPEHEVGAADPRPAAIESDPGADPQRLLLDRIAEVVRTRYEHVTVRQAATDPPHLLVTRTTEGFTPQWRVGAHVGELTREDVAAFLRHEPGPGSELVYSGGPAPSQALREEFLRRGVRIRSFTEFQGLLDLEAYLGAQATRLHSDSRYLPQMYVPQRFRELDRSRVVSDDLATELFRLVTSDFARFVLVLGDFGSGKSFVLRELARRIGEEMPHLIPILIDLRALDKAQSVHALAAAHLADHGEEVIDLKAFDYMLREGRIVLLFDGFDELVTRLTYDRAADLLQILLAPATEKAKIVVTSRTQHFKSEAQVFTALGEQVGSLPSRRILGIEGFTSDEIQQYLTKRYGGDEGRALARMRLMAGIQDLVGLAENPRMLSFIADLDDAVLRGAAGAGQTISAAGLYAEIVRSWLGYEAARTAVPGAPTGLAAAELWRAVTQLALRLWEAGETYLSIADLHDVASTLFGFVEGGLSAEQTAHAMGAGSLLVRTEEGLFGFIHGSVMEWLVARVIAEALDHGAPAPGQLALRPLSQLTVDFLCDLAAVPAARGWAERVLADPASPEIARANAIRITTRLRIPSNADLRGAYLRGEDLSYRDMTGIDLSEADLRAARLIGVSFDSATLAGTRLTEARLDEASLVGADLTGADLSRARLAQADLTGATLTGSTWHRAALIHPVGLDDPAGLPGAAVVPGTPVRTELAPGSLGVRHGFHAELGRLPRVLAYNPTGDLLAVGSDDGGVVVCDTATGRIVRTLQGHRGRVYSVAYGGDVLVTGSADGTVRIWDALTGEERHQLTGHDRWAWPVVVRRSGAEVVTGDAGGALRQWDAATGRLLRELPSDHGLVFDLVVHGDRAAAAYRDGSVHLWDLDAGRSVGVLEASSGPIYRVAFGVDGTVLATSGQAGSVALWDPADRTRTADLQGHSGRVYCLAFDPEGRRLVSGDTDGAVMLWDVDADGGTLVHRLGGHEASIYGVAFSADGGLATGDSAGIVRLWDPRTGRARHVLSAHTGSVWPFAFRPDGEQLAVSDDQFTTRLWDPATGSCRHVLAGHGRSVTSVQFHPDGDLLVATGGDGVVRLWEPRTGRQVRRLGDTEERLLRLEDAKFSPTGHRLVTVSNDKRLNLVNLDTGRYERHLAMEAGPIWAVAVSPSGDELATANDDDTVRVWYRATGRLVLTLGEHRGRVRSVAYSDDGTTIATGCDDSAVRLWDAETGRLERTLHGHTSRVYAVDFADGLLVSASWDSTARLWDAETGELRHVLTRHTGRLWSAAFSPRGRLLATAGDDLVIRLWDPHTGEHLHTLVGHTQGTWSVAFGPDGDLLASGGGDGTVRLWSIDGRRPEPGPVLLGLPEGWAVVTADGRYKIDGDVSGEFWNVVGMCRFEVGELDPFLPQVRQLTVDDRF